MFQRAFHRTEALDQIARAFFADPGRARNVVDGIAHQRQQIGHLRGLHAHELSVVAGSYQTSSFTGLNM